MPMRVPKADTSQPINCILWAMHYATTTGEPFTLRSVMHDLRYDDAIAGEFHDAADFLERQGELRRFRTRPGKRGRPTEFFYPVHLIEPATGGTHESTLWIVPAPTSEPAPQPHPHEHVEITGRLPDPEQEEEAPEPEAETPEDPPTGSFIPEPTSVPSGAHEHRPEKAPAEPSLTPSLETQPITESQGSDPEEEQSNRERAYTLMRNLITKSVKDRGGIGCTGHELRWILTAKGYTEQEAMTYAKALAGFEPEGHMEGGLRLEGPFSPHNKTNEPRYFIRTEAQSLSREDAEFEAEKLRLRSKGGQSKD